VREKSYRIAAAFKPCAPHKEECFAPPDRLFLSSSPAPNQRMRLLAISDIHNNLVAVRRMRAAEKNDFDAIVVAGDLGNASAPQVLKILSSFKCPVVYVYGNWDHGLDYVSAPYPGFHLIHLNVVTVDGIHFSGFSGCPTQWGKNPIAAKLADARDARERTLQLNRQALRKELARSKVDPRRTIIVTHERLARLGEIAPHSLLHVFGHIHGFSETTIKDTRFVNVSVLDRQVSARPRHKRRCTEADYRNFNAGNYVKIEIQADKLAVKSVTLPHDYPRWVRLNEVRYSGIPWIDEECEWWRASDPRITRSSINSTQPSNG
jgi:predicted phosphodiesterase